MKYTNMATAILLSMFVGSAYAATNTKEAAAKEKEAAAFEANNTGKNKRDTNNNELTAQDQSNRKSDVDVTRAIRQSIMDDKSLSTSAQNVKIIVTQNTVTLKGPVKTAQEITSIESKARAASPGKSIVNQLEVIQK